MKNSYSLRLWLLRGLLLAFFLAPLAHAAPAPSPSPVPASTPDSENVTDLSAEHASVEREKIYRAGGAYTRWLDGVAVQSGQQFLARRVFDRVTGMRLLASGLTLLLAGALAGWILWIIRRRAGRIESVEEQSWLALSFAAVRKPLALLAGLVGAFFALMPVFLGIADRGWRILLTHGLSTVLYGGRVIALLWLIFQGIRALEKRLRRWAKASGNVLQLILVPVIGQALRLSVPLLAIILLLPLLGLPESSTGLVQKLLGILLVVGICVLIVRGTTALQKGLMANHQLDAEDNMSARQIYTRISVIRRIIISAVMLVGGASILMMFGPLRQFGTSILASAGIAGVVLGFAAQKTLGNVLAGIQIALSQPMLIDDVVKVEGEFGRIEEITLTFVVVRTWDLRRLVFPITYFIEKPFQNWSRKSNDIVGTIFFYLDYQVSFGALREELQRLAEANTNWDRKVCALQVTDTKESTIEVRATVSSSNASRLFDLRCQLREGLIEFLRDRYPESLPRVRTALERGHDERSRVPENGRASAKPDRGATSPGLKTNDEQPANGRTLGTKTESAGLA
ncbi:MAG: mechanosensitive ion channel family protein [Chthoniobacterales bacterium]